MTDLLPEPHLGSLLRDTERVANLGPGSSVAPSLTDSDGLQFGSFGTGESGAADSPNGGRVVIDGAADGDYEQEVGGIGVHASRVLDDAEGVKGS